MSKNKSPDPSDAEDYLNQLDWQSRRFHRRTPWYLIPRWKYKPILRIKSGNPVITRAFFVGGFLILVGYLIYAIFSYREGILIFDLIIVLMIAAALFFAIRDVQNTFKDDD
jgi:hypothetical protein